MCQVLPSPPVYDILIAVTGMSASVTDRQCRNLKAESLRSSSVSFWRTLRAFGPATPSTPMSSVTFVISTLYLPSTASCSIHLGHTQNQLGDCMGSSNYCAIYTAGTRLRHVPSLRAAFCDDAGIEKVFIIYLVEVVLCFY